MYLMWTKSKILLYQIGFKTVIKLNQGKKYNKVLILVAIRCFLPIMVILKVFITKLF